MRKPNWTSRLALWLVVAGLTIWIVLQLREGYYQGKTLDAWFQEMRITGLFNGDQDQALHAFTIAGADALLFLEAKLRSENVEERRKAAWTLWRTESALNPQLRVVFRLFDDEDENVRRFGVDALGEMRPASDDTRSKMMDLLHDSDATVRLKAAGYLGDMGNAASSDSIFAALMQANNDTDARVRANSIWSLGKLNPQQALPVLINAVTNEELPARLRATMSLASMGSQATSAIPALIIALSDTNLSVRTEASNSLRYIDPKAAARTGVK